MALVAIYKQPVTLQAATAALMKENREEDGNFLGCLIKLNNNKHDPQKSSTVESVSDRSLNHWSMFPSKIESERHFSMQWLWSIIELKPYHGFPR